MNILVAIANYGTKNHHYLETLLKAYQQMRHKVDIVILSNEPKDLGPNIEVLVGTPTKNPWSLPFAHRPLFASRRQNYDLFIYSEDDTLINESNVEAFLHATRILPANLIAGFLRYEESPGGVRYISTAHAGFHWLPESVRKIDGEVFAQFSNDHSACFIMNRSQLESALASGGFLIPPHNESYDMLCSAATDPYVRCGFKKVINISRFKEFLLPHLPNKYVGKMGADYDMFTRQMEALKEICDGRRSKNSLLPEVGVSPHSRWARRYYEGCYEDLVELIPKGTKSVLSIGVGTGETELELARRGLKVTAVALDSVIAANIESRGVQVIACELNNVPKELGDRRFDCVIVRDLLYLLADPESMIRTLASLMQPEGQLVIWEPNFGSLKVRAGRILNSRDYKELSAKRCGKINLITTRDLRRWCNAAGLRVKILPRTPATAQGRQPGGVKALRAWLGSSSIKLIGHLKR
jgi:2-polyprenyl-3-methyl-5-hydroxy-6-metoxy-1,4-benzoquinol methylase